MSQELVSRAEAARLLGITTKTLDRWVARGVIRKIQVVENGRIRFRRSDIEALMRPDEEDVPALAS